MKKQIVIDLEMFRQMALAQGTAKPTCISASCMFDVVTHTGPASRGSSFVESYLEKDIASRYVPEYKQY